MMAAHHPGGNFQASSFSPRCAFGHCRRWTIFYTPAHRVVHTWNLGVILESSISFTATSDQSPSSFIFWIFCQSIPFCSFSLPSAQGRWGFSLLPASLQSAFHTGAGLSLSICTHGVKHGSHQQYEKYHGVLIFHDHLSLYFDGLSFQADSTFILAYA